MKYIFLDIDGVLNNGKHIRRQHDKYGGRFFCENVPFNPRSLRNLQRIVKYSNAQIVLTSSWGLSKENMIVLNARLIKYGLKIKDKIDNRSLSRGESIVKWLKENDVDVTKGDKFITIDDEVIDIKRNMDVSHIVHTDYVKGLTFKKTLEAIYKLKDFKHD